MMDGQRADNGGEQNPIEVVGIGNAIVDIISQVDDSFLTGHKLIKGAMDLIDPKRASSLYSSMSDCLETPGGSLANTMAGVSSFGGSAAFIGKVRDDALGQVFTHGMKSEGVGFTASPNVSSDELISGETGRCLIMVTPDAQRTMNTFLGVSTSLGPGDVDADLVAASKMLICEGYLWDSDTAKDAALKAIAVAKNAGAKVALTLCDSFCAERHRDEYLALLDDQVNVVFANESEIKSLFNVDDLPAALEAARQKVGLCCVTRGKLGSVLLTADSDVEVPAEEILPPIDTTGAGDQYAAGVAYGLTQGFDLAECGRLGSVAAAEVISHLGPRPNQSLAELVKV